MKLKSFFKRLFGGEIIEKINSPINGEILVVKELSGKTVMRVGKIVQSGGLVEKIWESALSQVKSHIPKGFPKRNKSKVESSLVLGLGCGTVAELINKKWPEAQITGVEIDKEVIGIGKKYFDLDKIKNLSILNEDAIWWITSKFALVNKSRYDLILVDLYKGQEFPKEAEGEEFISGLKKILNKNGLIIFNRLYFGKHKNETEKFRHKLKQLFPKVSLIRTNFNHFLVCESAS